MAPKKPAPRKAAPKKPAPRKAAPRKASPKKASPKKAAPRKASPKKAAPQQGQAAHGHTHAHDHSHAHGHGHSHAHGHAHGHAHDAHDHDHAEHEGHARAHASAGAPGLHAHSSGDGHGHAHEAHPGAPRPTLLREGDGAGKTLFFDTFSGIAGDMTIAALLDLGVPLLVVERAIAALPISGFHLHRGHAHRSAIVACTFDVHLESPQPHRNFREIDAMLAAAPLEPAIRQLSRRIFKKLGEAEAFVHKMPLAEVHFHEVGAVDAIVDIVGAAAALTHLGADVVATPLPMGRGFIRAAHGRMPNPPPAVVECLRGCPTYAVDTDFELVTPTGAAIISTVAKRFVRWPEMAPARVGYGAGRRDLPDRPNLLRVVLGDAAPTEPATPGPETHVVLEANVDDLTGEVAAHALDALRTAGALDVWATPVLMKKGRPGLVISALTTAALAAPVGEILLRETSTIGLRRTPVSRVERPRRTLTVATPFGAVRCKVAEGPFGPAQLKPEYEDCARLARQAGVPLRVVMQAALAAAPGLSGPDTAGPDTAR